jgi:hypothetical protein
MRHVLYGAKRAALASVGQVVSSALAVDFVERESDYLGVYLTGMVGSNRVRIVNQLDPEGEPLEPDYPECNVLVYLDGSEEMPSLDNLEFEGGVIRILRE